MQKCWIEALNASRGDIHRRWEALLRLERADTPIADPEYLVHLIDWTLDEIFARLRSCGVSGGNGAMAPSRETLRAQCHCGHNPLSKHFIAGEQALLETLILVQANDPACDRIHRSTAVTELYVAIHAVERREVESLCSLCTRPRTRVPASPVSETAPH